MATLFQRKGFYYIRIWDRQRNKVIEHSTRTKDIGKARAVLRASGVLKIEHAAQAGALTEHLFNKLRHGRAKLSMFDLANEWADWMKSINQSQNTVCAGRMQVREWLRWVNKPEASPADFTEADIDGFINRESGNKASTLVLKLSRIQSFFKWLGLKGFVSANPAALVRVNFNKLLHVQKEKKIREPFTPEEIACLLSHANEFWKCMILIGQQTGLRLGDIVCFEKDSIGDNAIAVWTRKKGKRIELQLTPALLEALRAIPENDPQYLFPAERHTYINYDTRAQLSVQFLRMAQKCGVVGKSFAHLRNNRAIEIEKTHGIVEAAKQLGHSSTKTTEIYLEGRAL